MKCANCGSLAHMANYGGCPKMKQAKEIEIISHTESITYSEAKNKYFTSSTPSRQHTHAGTSQGTFNTQFCSHSNTIASSQITDPSMTYADVVNGKTSVTATVNTVPVNIFSASQFVMLNYKVLRADE